MTCFCGCEEFEKNPNGQFVGCVTVSYTHLTLPTILLV